MLQQIPSDEAKQEITRQFGDLRRLYNFFDEDNGGSISVDELRVIVEVRLLLAAYDAYWTHTSLNLTTFYVYASDSVCH